MKNLKIFLVTMSSLMAFHANATLINFTAAEGYTDGALGGQTASGVPWFATGSPSATVDSTLGTVAVPTFANGQRLSPNVQVNVTAGQVWKASVDFSLSLNAANYNAGGSNVSAAANTMLFLGSGTFVSDNAMRINLQKPDDATNWKMTFFNAGGSGAGGFAQSFFQASALGINTVGAADLVSDQLRMSMEFTRDSSTNVWNGSYTLRNLDTDTEIISNTFLNTLNSSQEAAAGYFATLAGADTGEDLVISRLEVVPEPSSLMLIGLGATVLYIGRRKKLFN